MEGEFEQIMTKIRWSIKENNNYITVELHVFFFQVTFILYFLQILGAYFYPIQKLRFYWTVLCYYHRACVSLVVKFEIGTKGLIFFKTSIPDDTFFSDTSNELVKNICCWLLYHSEILFIEISSPSPCVKSHYSLP